MERTKADIEMQTEVIESYSTAVTAIVQKYMPAGTVNLKEKPLAEMDLKKYAACRRHRVLGDVVHVRDLVDDGFR